jgi:hypothetical protein
MSDRPFLISLRTDLDQSADSLGAAGDDGLFTPPVIDDEQPLVSHPQLERFHAFIHPVTVGADQLTARVHVPSTEPVGPFGLGVTDGCGAGSLATGSPYLPWYDRMDRWCHRNAERVQASVCAFLIFMLGLAAYSELIHPAFTGKRWLMTIVCQGEPLSVRCPAIYHEGKTL